ncbi:hypothetical protein pb186bvf_005000 [Paramecium bursaria]
MNVENLCTSTKLNEMRMAKIRATIRLYKINIQFLSFNFSNIFLFILRCLDFNLLINKYNLFEFKEIRESSILNCQLYFKKQINKRQNNK